MLKYIQNDFPFFLLFTARFFWGPETPVGWASYDSISVYIGKTCHIEIWDLDILRFLTYDRVCMKAGWDLFAVRNYEALNSRAKPVDQINFINLAFCSEGCHGDGRAQTWESAKTAIISLHKTELTFRAFPFWFIFRLRHWNISTMCWDCMINNNWIRK